MNRCPLCPGDHNCVPPSGPEDSPILFLGEGPGFDEDRKLVPFTGKTGREVNEHYLPLAGLRRENCRFDNTMKCMPKGKAGKMEMNRSADRELAVSCATEHIYPQLECNHYTLIVAMGAFACHVLDESIGLELQHGIPVETKWGVVFPMFHPAGGIHEPKKMLQIRNDWVRLRKYLAGKLLLPEDEYAGREQYQKVETVGGLTASLPSTSAVLANDTESTRDRDPYCLTYSVKPGTGFLIKAERLDLLEAYQGYLDRWQGPIIWHNWLYDQAVVGRMGLKYPRKLIADTMVRSFHLGNLPQGLKALSYRELGMAMQDFEDLVSPYSSKLVVDYYWRMFTEHEWSKPESFMYRDPEGLWKIKQPHSMKTKLKTFFTYLRKAQEKGMDKDVFEAWDNWEDSHKLIEDKMEERWPGKCITHVPFEQVLHYACRDADATLRLWPVLQKMRAAVRHTSQEHWRDVA